MKILFVCRANVGRSQAAKAFYNLKHPGMADSAGTLVDIPGQQLRQRPGAFNIISVMSEYGVDMSKYTRQQTDKAMLKSYDKVIVMAEPETIPEWLLSNDKTVLWDVSDPKGQSLERTREIVEDIRAKVDAVYVTKLS